ncbi:MULTISPECIES: SPW repeat domain-containing protein [Halorussus]|uniref:SPW repeat domain-containing protein n=1 Tax=Halorussus TaxID=1070314 RepID=UPI0020A01E51|nr:SPW repeat protein [Halorussus vallis]USZ77304.1 SPW repeat protein [Halorussus vallis]
MDNNAQKFSWVIAVLGAWLIAAPFAFEVTRDVVMWSHVIAGLGILAFAAYNGLKADDDSAYERGSSGLSLVTLLLGLYVVAVPFLFEVARNLLLWNDVVVGLVVAMLAAYNVYEARRRRTETRDRVQA